MEKRRTLIIGLDGVPHALLIDLAEKGIMPSVKALIEDGVLKRMSPSIPDVSSVSWSSIITGRNPGEHGVFGFTYLIKGTYTLAFHDFTKLRAPTFWQADPSRRYMIINVPSTYPALELNGFMVSGFVSPDLSKAVYPPSYIKYLREVGYRIDIDVERGRRSPMLLFKELSDVLKARLDLCKRLWKKVKWDVLMFVITGTDRLEHFLWSAYEEADHEWHEHFLSFFQEVDRAIGELVGRLKDRDNLIMLSDHGMERLYIEVNLNALLASEGYLILGDEPRRGYGNIRPGTQAFALEPSRIYLNLEGKFPRGSVRPEEADDVLEELTDLFTKLKWDGKKVVKKVWRKEDIYHGPYMEDAPDLVLIPNEGFAFISRISGREVFKKSNLTGKHNEDAFLYVRGKENAPLIPSDPSVEDVVKIMRALISR